MEQAKKFKILCPDCQAEIVVDGVTGQILFHESKKSDEDSPKKKSMQDLMKEMEEKRKQASNRFEEEKEALKHRSEYLEKKFEEMKKHVDTSDEAPPPHPFDYD